MSSGVVQSRGILRGFMWDGVQPIMHETGRGLPRSTCGFGAK